MGYKETRSEVSWLCWIVFLNLHPVISPLSLAGGRRDHRVREPHLHVHRQPHHPLQLPHRGPRGRPGQTQSYLHLKYFTPQPKNIALPNLKNISTVIPKNISEHRPGRHVQLRGGDAADDCGRHGVPHLQPGVRAVRPPRHRQPQHQQEQSAGGD